MFAVQFEETRGKGGLARFQGRLGDMSHRALDLEPAYQKIHESFLQGERDRFNGANDWRPLTPRYLRWKAAHGLDERVMRATGELHRAMTTGAGPGAVTRIGAQEAEFGTDLQRAVYAQRSKTPRRRRRVLVITKARRGRWTTTIRNWITEGTL